MERNKTGNGEEEREEILRINVSRLGGKALSEVMERVNNGFMGGKVSKSQIANWILKRFRDDLDELLIKDIRADHFDEVAVLELILRKAKETGKVPSEFKHLLQKQIGLEVPMKKKMKQALTEDCINGVVAIDNKN